MGVVMMLSLWCVVVSGCFNMIIVKMFVLVLMLFVCGVIELVVIMLVLVLFLGG